MQFERGVLTSQGIALMNVASHDDQLVFTKFLFTSAEFEPSKDLTDLPTPTWGNGHATGAVSGSNLSVYLEATNKDDSGYMRGYGVWGHLESKASEGDVLLMTAKAIPPITQVTQASGAWTVFRLTLTIAYEVGEGSVTITPSYAGYVSDVEFQKFAERCVTTHAEDSTTTGDDQTIRGEKSFLDAVHLRSTAIALRGEDGLAAVMDFDTWKGTIRASSKVDGFYVTAPVHCGGSMWTYDVDVTTTTKDDLMFEFKHVDMSATDYTLYVSGGFVLNFENTSDGISYSPNALGEGVGALALDVDVVTVENVVITTNALGVERPMLEYNDDGIYVGNVNNLALRADDACVIGADRTIIIGADGGPETTISGSQVSISVSEESRLSLAGHRFDGICRDDWEPYTNRMWAFEFYAYMWIQDDTRFMTYVSSTYADMTPCLYLEEGAPANMVAFILGGLSMSSGSAVLSCIFAPHISFPSGRNSNLVDYSYIPDGNNDPTRGRVAVKAGKWTLKQIYSDLLDGLGNDTVRAYDISEVNPGSGVYWLLVVKGYGTYRFFK